MMNTPPITGRPSIDRPWMKYYPEPLRKIQIPECTVQAYLRQNCPGEDVAAMEFYGNQISWRTVFDTTQVVAKSLRAIGFGEGDQIPVFLSLVPEFLYILLGAEQIGASLLCRDNTLQENVEAVAKAGAKVMIAQSTLSQDELGRYLADTQVEKVILVDPCCSCNKADMPDYVQENLEKMYPEETAHGTKTITW